MPEYIAFRFRVGIPKAGEVFFIRAKISDLTMQHQAGF